MKSIEWMDMKMDGYLYWYGIDMDMLILIYI